jgi:ArsR family transcriptional regulator
MIMNMLSGAQSKEISQLFKLVSHPFRIRLLLTLAEGEACVCHLESLLGKRQAYISQHLMALREFGFISARRDGKFVFYKLEDLGLLTLIRQAAELQGFEFDKRELSAQLQADICECPNCGPH